ncbi:MAG TPA: IS256 family transposase [Phycisphaerae bacterium]|jgi:putative transposase|nr:IS256 family transposase [Phycisphaerae bacterium]
MASTAERASKVKDNRQGEAREVVEDQLEALAREGARRMLCQALSEEVDAYLGRGRYERTEVYRGYRNGSTPRKLTLGSGTIDVAVPRVRGVPAGQEPFESKIVRKYQRRSDTIDETFMNLFVEGLATRDFEPALRLLVGQDAPLSPSTISRLTKQFKEQYEAFDRKNLSGQRFVYIWADGIYLKAGLGTEKACLMVLIGADTAGVKHLIALREGYRETTESWSDLIRDCRKRGLNEPACWIADGALGLWAAVNEQSRNSAQQRCTNHKTVNVIDKLPVKERPAWVPRVRAIWQADSEQAARRLHAAVVHDLREAGYDRAADCLADDVDRCLTFYQFPEAHWIHLRTTNPIESIFASVRLRTNAAKRFKKTKSGVCLMHQVIERLSKGWRRLRSAHLCPTVPLPSSSSKKQSKVA